MSQEQAPGMSGAPVRSAKDAAVRRVSWGEGIIVAAHRSRGGLNVAVNLIHEVVGDYIGVRNSFSKLTRVESPDELNGKDAFRAWLLLTALRERPSEWGIADAVVPPGFDIGRLRESLCPNPPSPDGLPAPGSATELDRLANKKRARRGAPRANHRYAEDAA